MKGRVCAKPIIELVQTWPSLILNQLNGKCDAPPTFPVAPLGFEYLPCRMCILSFGGDCTHV